MTPKLHNLATLKGVVAGIIVCSNIEKVPTYESAFSPSVWQEVFKLPKHRQIDRILGRLAIKAVTTRYLVEQGQQAPLQSEIEVVEEEGGGRFLTVAGQRQTEVLFSISHTNSHISAAVLTPKEDLLGIGVDVESIRVFEIPFARRFMNQEEFAYWQALPEARRAEVSTTMWCLKEAFSKALGVGLRRNPQLFNTLPYLERAKVKPNREDVAWWSRIEKDYILAIIKLKNTTYGED